MDALVNKGGPVFGLHEGNISGIPTRPDDREVARGTHAGCIDKVPCALKPDFCNGMEIWWVNIGAISGSISGQDIPRARKATEQMGIVPTNPFARHKRIKCRRGNIGTARDIGERGRRPVEDRRDLVLSQLRSSLPPHLCCLSFKCQGGLCRLATSGGEADCRSR